MKKKILMFFSAMMLMFVFSTNPLNTNAQDVTNPNEEIADVSEGTTGGTIGGGTATQEHKCRCSFLGCHQIGGSKPCGVSYQGRCRKGGLGCD